MHVREADFRVYLLKPCPKVGMQKLFPPPGGRRTAISRPVPSTTLCASFDGYTSLHEVIQQHARMARTVRGDPGVLLRVCL